MNNKKATKRALLTSVMALVMCVVMLVGTTFAWFTDTASTGVNKIVSGNLKVDIIGADSEDHVEKLNFTKATGAENEELLWEPGCRYLTEGFRIANNGNLALKWKAEINKDNIVDGKVVDTAKDGVSLLDVIDFYVVTKAADGTETEVAIKDFTGHLAKDEKSSVVYYIKGVMQTTAGNDYQDLTLDGITITVYATQDTVESDSFDNKYDEKAPLDFVPVSNQAELQNAINAAAPGEAVNVSLEGNITIDDTMYVIGKNVGANVGDVTIQANGKTLTSTKEQATRCMRIEYTSVERDITIIGAKVVSEGTKANGSGNGANENRGLALFDVKNATINLVNCEIEMKANDYAYAIKMINCNNVTLNLTGCTLTGANCIETNGGDGNTINITDCVFNSNYAPNATYCGQGIQDKDGNNNTFNIKNTTFNGTNAQPWETNATTVINDLGGNVNNTTRTTA